jgi:hypothetical protein
MRRPVAGLLLAMPCLLTAQAKTKEPALVQDSIQIAVAGPLKGDRCSAWKFDTPDSGAKKAKLSASLVPELAKKIDSAGTTSVDKTIKLLLNGGFLADLTPGMKHVSVPLALSDLQGKSLTVLYASPDEGVRWYCTLTMRQPEPAAKADDSQEKKVAAPSALYIATGAEFASADGFQSKQVRIPVVARWDGELHRDGDFLLTFTNMGEAGAVAIPQQFMACLPTAGAPVAKDTTTDAAAVAANPCRIRRYDAAPGGMFVPTTYSLVKDSIRTDSTAVTGLSWRLSALLRFEWAPLAKNMYFGIPFFGAFQTNPAGAFSKSIGHTWRSGISFRQLDDKQIPVLEVMALLGPTQSFSESTTTTYVHPFSKTDSTTTSLVTRSIRGTQGALIRGFFRPTDGFMFRGVVELDRAGTRLATISVLKTIDLGAALKIFGL